MSSRDESHVAHLNEAVGRLESFSYEDMREWLASALRGRDVLLPSRAEDSSAYAIAAIYPHLSRFAREHVLRATMSLLYDLAAGREWTDRPAEELLFLVQHLVPEEARETLAKVATSDRFRSLEDELRYWILQTLVALRARMRPEFWRRVFWDNQCELAALAFAGLSLISPAEAISLLPLLPDDEDVAKLIYDALAGFVTDAGPDHLPEIRSSLIERLPDIPSIVRNEILRFFQEEGAPLGEEPTSDWLGDELSFEQLSRSLYALDEADLELVGAPAPARI